MSSAHPSNTSSTFSNTETGSKAADPYKEKNADNQQISLRDKVEDLLSFIEAQKFGMMTTRQNQSGLLVSRCMALAARENGIDLIFHTNTESHKTDELHSDPHINVAFIKSGTGEWASLSGVASIETDRERVKGYYSQQIKAWIGDLGDGVHDGGPSDPRVGIIKVKVVTVSYALQKGTAISRGIEVAKGAITGSTAHTNKLREITEDELQKYRSIHQSAA